MLASSQSSDVMPNHPLPSVTAEQKPRETTTVAADNSNPEAEELEDVMDVAPPFDGYDIQEAFFDGRPGFREKPRSRFALEHELRRKQQPLETESRQREPEPLESGDSQQSDEKPSNGSKKRKPRYRNHPKWPARKPGTVRREIIRIARP